MGHQLAGSSAVFRLPFLGFLSLWRSSYERALCLQDRFCASYTALNNGREASKNTRSLVHRRIWKALRGNLATRGAWKSRVSRCIFSRGNIVSGCLLPERLLTERFALSLLSLSYFSFPNVESTADRDKEAVPGNGRLPRIIKGLETR